MSKHHEYPDDLAALEADLTPQERDELAAASAALDIARLVYAAREARSLTQSAAAAVAGIQQQVVSRMEGGNVNVTIRTFERYLRNLEVAVEIGIIDERTGAILDTLILNDDHGRAMRRAQMARRHALFAGQSQASSTAADALRTTSRERALSHGLWERDVNDERSLMSESIPGNAQLSADDDVNGEQGDQSINELAAA